MSTSAAVGQLRTPAQLEHAAGEGHVADRLRVGGGDGDPAVRLPGGQALGDQHRRAPRGRWAGRRRATPPAPPRATGCRTPARPRTPRGAAPRTARSTVEECSRPTVTSDPNGPASLSAAPASAPALAPVMSPVSDNSRRSTPSCATLRVVRLSDNKCGRCAVELSWGRRYVMVRPDHFRVDYQINPFMDVARQPDPALARAPVGRPRGRHPRPRGPGRGARAARRRARHGLRDEPRPRRRATRGPARRRPPATSRCPTCASPSAGWRPRRRPPGSPARGFTHGVRRSRRRRRAPRGGRRVRLGRRAGRRLRPAHRRARPQGAWPPSWRSGSGGCGSPTPGCTTSTSRSARSTTAAPSSARRRSTTSRPPRCWRWSPSRWCITEEEALTTFAANSIVIGRTVLMPACPSLPADRVRARLEARGLRGRPRRRLAVPPRRRLDPVPDQPPRPAPRPRPPAPARWRRGTASLTHSR